MLELRNVSKRFGQQVALHPLDLTIEPRKTTVLLGPSGCGKSTLLRLIVGLLRPDSGAIYFGDQELSAANIVPFRRRMGYMIQDGGLFPHLNVRDNVTLLARHLRWEKTRIEKRLEKVAGLVQLPLELLGRFPVQISGGQRQRVALMRALFLDPDVLLLDEPMGALDPLIRSQLQTELCEIFRALQKTVVMVTHDIGEASYLADIVVLLDHGRIVQRGGWTDFVNSPADPFVTKFLNAQRLPLENARTA